MTKKDYIIIAKVLNETHLDQWSRGIIESLVIRLSKEFIMDNPKFDIDKFRKAVYK